MQVCGSDNFAETIATLLNCEFVSIEKTVFPDFEVRPRFLKTEFSGKVVLIERMKVPVDPNAYVIELLLEINTLKDMGAETVDVVMPYFVYSRQDKAFREGEPFSAKYIVDLLRHAGAGKIYVVESHTRNDFGAVKNIDGFVAIGRYFFSAGAKGALVIAPDEKAARGAQTVAREIEGDVAVMRKTRDRGTGEIITDAGNLDARGREVIIVDDIVSSGKTMLNALRLAREAGARRIQCAVVHPITQRGIFNVSKEADGFFACDTVDSALSVIPTAGMITEAIKRDNI
ncbi:MAG: ribose-phosphate diphosphokinase [Candidatus Aenigmarchaeota archaeon]|nr:ribose-phosphate diphosphokinase [Candidatus Aenigmarchaeota archaeon]